MDKLRQSIQEANEAVALERKKNVDLLYLIFPPQIAQKLWLGESVEAHHCHDVTVLFSDIVGFTSICSTATPMIIINMLNQLYTMFDQFCGEIDVYKIETIGDAYCVASGLHKSSPTHAQQAAFMAIKMITAVQTVKDHEDRALRMRIGLHSGSVLAGIVGQKMPRYCLFGNNVSLGNKFESTSEPLRINVSPTTYDLLMKWNMSVNYKEERTHGYFTFTERSRDCLPKGFPTDIHGTCYFLDDYQHPRVKQEAHIFQHISEALNDILTPESSASMEQQSKLASLTSAVGRMESNLSLESPSTPGLKDKGRIEH